MPRSVNASTKPSCSSRADQSLRQEHVTGDTTVAQLKGRITSEVGIPYLCMKLFAGTKELRDLNGSIGCRFGFGPNRFRALGLWRRGRIRCRSSAMVLQGTPPCRCRPGWEWGWIVGLRCFRCSGHSMPAQLLSMRDVCSSRNKRRAWEACNFPCSWQSGLETSCRSPAGSSQTLNRLNWITRLSRPQTFSPHCHIQS